MKAGGGKTKGGQFEREIAKTLSLWISIGENPNIFWRSASSGAKATTGFKKGIKDDAQAGDICAVDPSGATLINNFFIELKFYRNLHMESMIYGKPAKNSILEFWNKAQEQALQYNKIPVVIAKQNGQSIKLITNYTGWNLMTAWWGNPDNYIIINKYEAYIFDFEFLINKCDPKMIGWGR